MMTTVTAAALVYAMVAWINSTGLIEPAWPTAPLEVNITNPAGLVHDMHRCHDMQGIERMPDDAVMRLSESVLGIYCLDRVTINGLEVNLDSPSGQMVLVHELVHWIQDYNGEAEAAQCVAELERNAYAVGHHWQSQMGLPMQPDPFTVMVRSTCHPEHP